MLNRRRLSLFAVALIAGGGLLTAAFTAPPAFAASAPAPTPTGDRLERAYERLLDAEQHQQDRLDRAGDVRARTEAWIDRLEDEGGDTSALRSALQTFLDGAAEAQTLHNEAASILDRHAGFDEDGKVTDVDLARETVIDAAYALRQAHLVIAGTVMDFRYAVRDYRQSIQAAAAQA